MVTSKEIAGVILIGRAVKLIKVPSKKPVRTQRRESSSDSESVGLTVQHAMSNHSWMDAWIVGSGATSHMCVEYESPMISLKVTLGDGYEVDAVGCGTVVFNSALPCGKSRKCKLHDVLHVLRLSHNLFSVSVATEDEKTMCFEKENCQILDKGKLVTLAVKVWKLYCLKC